MRLLPEAEVGLQVEEVASERRLRVHGDEVLADVRLEVEVVADGGVGPVPGLPEEGFVEGLELARLLRRVEERVVPVVVRAAVVLGRVRVHLVHGAGDKFRVVGQVVERRHAVPVAPAERAEGGLVGRVDAHVDALAVGVGAVCVHSRGVCRLRLGTA